ncbi:hypothetical protein G7Z17_g12335 [Cylindrodendrum hubeiense]|uniref:DASH complex subunit DAD3 n=1 Tax=Cylindrodendrum hubeiense TaxID=595255 RepID=A0A9P5H3B7_9HYPO|nr:hypothetical protein G7Z17_g12335 [Cylindrodendrum hubeiense]
MDHTSTGGGLLSQPELSPLEQEVLDEYERLAENMSKVCPSTPVSFCLNRKQQPVIDFPWQCLTDAHDQLATILDHLASNPSTEILDGLRELERKTSLAFTLLKASVYSIVLQQEIDWGDRSNA